MVLLQKLQLPIVPDRHPAFYNPDIPMLQRVQSYRVQKEQQKGAKLEAA